jgi:hypothetical protein
MIEQVLHDRQIEIERTRLKHHAKQPQGFARRIADVVAEYADPSSLNAEQPGDQRNQRTLARAIEAEQSRETRRCDIEGDIRQRLPTTIAMADACDRQSGCDRRQVNWLRRVVRDLFRARCVDRGHGRAMATPQGNSPT